MSAKALGGEGKIIKEPCQDCKGKGTVRESAKIKVKIPEGIDDGQTVVLRGEGEPLSVLILLLILFVLELIF